MTQTSTLTQPTGYSKMLVVSVVIAILLLAINMRTPLIGFGTVAKFIQHDLSLSTKVIGLLGTIPVMAFAISSFVAPMISRKLGLENTLVIAALLLALGIFGRSWQDELSFLLVGTIVLSVAISLGNVLVPAVIKKYTPSKISFITGTYSLFLSMFAGLAAGVMPMLVAWQNWQFALGVWGWVSVAALLAWLWVLHLFIRHNLANAKANTANVTDGSTTQGTINTDTLNADLAYEQPRPRRSVWGMPMAWSISIYMGLQSLLYYTFASFLPSLLMDQGLSQASASQMGMIFQMMAFPSIILLSKWVAAGWNLRVLAIAAALGNLIGVLGFGFLSMKLAWLWAISSGFGCGVIFTLCIMLFTIKARDSQQTAELSGMAQTIGYGIAVLGPIVTGWLEDMTHGWTIPMTVLLMLMIINLGFSWLATQDKPIDA